MRDFRLYTIWQDGIRFVKKRYTFSESLPKDEKFGLISQIKRASVSIPSNIAEGSSRKSDKKFKRFLEIALGYAFEVETQLIIVNELKDIKNDEIKDLNEDLNSLQRSINSLIQKIKAKN